MLLLNRYISSFDAEDIYKLHSIHSLEAQQNFSNVTKPSPLRLAASTSSKITVSVIFASSISVLVRRLFNSSLSSYPLLSSSNSRKSFLRFSIWMWLNFLDNYALFLFIYCLTEISSSGILSSSIMIPPLATSDDPSLKMVCILM